MDAAMTNKNTAPAKEKSPDLTGMRSGRLTVVGRTDQRRRGSVLWRCRCDCGNEILAEAYKIRSGLVASCGCSRKGHGIKDITGQQFGRLTALYRLEKKQGSSYLWPCRCSCGNEVEVPVNGLLFGKRQSCGCARTESLQNRDGDIRGQQFGRLTAIEPLDRRYHGSVVWRCRCSCGNEYEAPYNMLLSGNTTSCGCKKKEHPQPPLHYVEGTCIEMIDQQNLRKDNTSGCTGVTAVRNGRWRAELTFRGKRYFLGTYINKQNAINARKEAEDRIFGGFLEKYYEESPLQKHEYENKRKARMERLHTKRIAV